MNKLLILFSHKLTEEQVIDAKKNLEINEFIYLPEYLQKIWSNVNPYIDDKSELLKIFDFIKNNLAKNDYALIQGEWGYVYDTINYCKSLDIIPIYATTERFVSEINKGNGQIEKTSIFKHVMFKKY